MKTVLAVAIVIVGIGLFGCGTPCDDFLTELEDDDVDGAIARVFVAATLGGVTREDALQRRLERLNCECLDCGCRSCAEWLIDSVYTAEGLVRVSQLKNSATAARGTMKTNDGRGEKIHRPTWKGTRRTTRNAVGKKNQKTTAIVTNAAITAPRKRLNAER